MQTAYSPRYRRNHSATRESLSKKKSDQHEPAFFSGPSNDSFFRPNASISRKCDHCAAEEKMQSRSDSQRGDGNGERMEEKKEEKPVMKMDEKKEEDKSVHKMEEKKEEKPLMKADEKKEEKPIMKMDEKKEEKAVMKMDEKKEEKVVQKTDEKKEEKISKKEAAESGSANGHIGAYLKTLDGKGMSLPEDARHFFQKRMGHDFSGVRIHTGADAEQSAKDISAKAYAVDNHIVFNKGQYNPGSFAGRKLLAHELTHVAQQRGDSNVEAKIQRQAAPAPALTGLNVSNATPVQGHLADQFVVARNAPSGQVIINANVTNIPVTGPAANTVNWRGGSAGPSPLQRLVRVSSAGEFNITATVNGTSTTIKVFIVNTPPAPPAASSALLQHIFAGAANPGANFGLTVVTIGQQGVRGPEFTINPFLNGDHWEFRASEIRHRYKMGVSAGAGLTNITGPADSRIRPSNVCNIITDLTPPAPGVASGPPRNNFWSKSITTQHEQAHVNRFYSAPFWEAQMRLFEAFVNGLNIPFTSAIQTPAAVLATQQATLRTQADTFHAAADALEITGAEVACHGISNPMYTQLITGITNTAAPTAPTGLAASAVTQNAVSLAWNQVNCIETGFIVERRTNGRGAFAQVGNTAAGLQSLTDAGLTPGTRLQYRVRATGAGRNSAFSNTINVQTLP